MSIPGTRDFHHGLLVNVFYNPGGEGAHFDYGYKGGPSYIELGFDASKASHRFAIEWSPCEILWWVDDHLVHRRVIWDPTPIPHLPMALHVNSWPSRSTQLAGRINSRRLPATTIVRDFRFAGPRWHLYPGFPICWPQMAPLYTREPPSARNSVRRTIVQLQRPSFESAPTFD